MAFGDLDWKSCGWSPLCSAADAVAGCGGLGPARLRCKGQVFLSRSGEKSRDPRGDEESKWGWRQALA